MDKFLITRQQSWTRYQIIIDNSPAKLDSLPARGALRTEIRTQCEVKREAFDQRTTLSAVDSPFCVDDKPSLNYII